jgi:hypothetical protein
MNKYEEEQYLKKEWKQCKRINPELCTKLEKEREIWFKGLQEEIKNGADVYEIKLRELRIIVDRQNKIKV